MQTPKLIVLDTETTGRKDPVKIVEIAWQELDLDFNTVRSVQSLIDPQAFIEYGAIGVHGIYPEHLVDAPTIEEFFEIVEPNAFGDAPVVLIAHNVKYDQPLVERFIPNLVKSICTLRLAKRFLPDSENFQLQTLRAQYRLPGGDSHRADGDVATCVSLLKMIVEREQKPLLTLADIADQPILVKNFPLGKYFGQPIAECTDKGWMSWALGPKGITDIDPDFKFTLQQRIAQL